MPDEAPPAPPPAAPAAPPSSNPTGAPPLATLSSAWDNLEKLGSAPASEPPTVPKSPAQKSVDTAKANDPTKPPDPKPAEPPAAKSDDQADPPKPGDTVTPQKSKKPADFLREELTKTTAERDQFKAEIEKLKAPKEDPEKKALTEKLEAETKRREELEQEMRFTNYEKSPEYKEKFEKPYTDAWNAGRSWVSQLKVTDAEGNSRLATAQEFDTLMNLSFTDPDRASEEVAALFGNKSASVISHMLDVQKASRAATEASEMYRKQGSEREQQSVEFRKALEKKVSDRWLEHKKPDSIPDKWKPFLTPKDGDDDGNKMLEAGYRKFDEAMGLDARKARTESEREEILGKTAAQRHLAANARRLIKWVEQRDALIVDLQKELAAFKTSEPGAGDGEPGAKAKGPAADTMAGALNALDKKATAQFF